MKTPIRSLAPRFFACLLPILFCGWPSLQASGQDIGPILTELHDLTAEALEAARQAAEAPTVEAVKQHADQVFEAVWGMSYGVTKGERPPRVDLTYQWDAPVDFWMSTADTGWLHEAFAQALNILKTDYGDDVEMARSHAADMVDLLEKTMEGVDANSNGSIEPVRMEGGLLTAMQHAGFAGITGN